MWISSFSSTTCWKDYLLPLPTLLHPSQPLNGLGIIVENHLTINVWIYFWTLKSMPLVYMFTLMPRPHSFDYCSFVVKFDIRKWILFFFFKIVLAIQHPLHFQMNFRKFPFPKKENKNQKPSSQNFNGDYTESVDKFGEYCHLNNILIHEHGMTFYLFRYALISLYEVFRVFSVQVLHFLV